MAEDSKVTININNQSSENSLDDVANLIDNLMSGGASRLKINTSDELQFGEYTKVYHHGRCDIGSPFACGTPFDVLK